MIISIFTGLLLSLFNALSGLIIAKFALKKEQSKVNKIIYLSLLVRYFLTMVLVWVCLKFFELEHLAFGLSFLISTFIFLLAEILYLNFRANFLNLQIRGKK